MSSLTASLRKLLASPKLFQRLNAGLLALIVCAAAVGALTGPVQQVPNVAYLRSHNLTSFPALVLGGYYTDGDGGEGYFTKRTCAGAAIDEDDGGFVFQDAAGNCFERKHGGGPVSIKWYGVDNAASSDNPSGHDCLADMASCDAKQALDNAFAASAAYGTGGVTTSGRTIAVMSGDLNVTGDFTGETSATGQVADGTYWLQSGALVFNPANEIYMKAGTRLWKFSAIRPSWFVPGWIPATNATLADVVAGMRNMTGTAVVCAEQACRIEDVSIIGFDVCIDMSESPFSFINNVNLECHVGLYSHAQEGGFRVSDVQTKAFINQIDPGCWNPPTCNVSGAVHNGKWPVSSVADDGTGQVQVTITDTSPLYQTNGIQAGWRVIVSGLNDNRTVDLQPPATLTANSAVLNSVGLLANGKVDSTVGYIQLGFRPTAKDHASCIGSGVRVAAVVINTVEDEFTTGPAGVAKITLSAAVTNSGGCNLTFEEVAFTGESTAPPGGNGVWLVASVSGDNIVLKGSSWAGPSYATTWVAGAKAIQVFDATNIKLTQSLCTTGTAASAPYCTAPAGWAFSTTTITNTNSVLDGTTATGAVDLGSTANWPAVGFVKCGSGEEMAYERQSATRIRIKSRGARGSTPETHANGDACAAAAPTVIAVVPSPRRDADAQENIPNYVIVSDAPYASGSGTVKFTNPSTLSAGYVGELNVLPVYQYYSGLDAAGSVPADQLTTTGTGGSGVTTLTGVANWHKIFRGMRVRNITTPGDIPDDTVVTNDPSSGTITISAATNAAVTGDTLVFDGAGGPIGQPWLGNRTGTSFLLTGESSAQGNEGGVQGFVGSGLHSANDRVALHLNNSPAANCANLTFSSGGHSGAQRDESSVGIWIDGLTDVVQCTTSMVKGKYIGILNTSGKNNDGIAFSEFHSSAWGLSIVNEGYGTNMAVSGLHTKADTPIFTTANAQAFNLSGTFAPAMSLVTDDPAAMDFGDSDRNVYCGNNTMLAGGVCSDSGAALPLAMVPQGRLSLSSSAAVMSSAVSAGTTVYYLPYTGVLAPVYDAKARRFVPYRIGASGMSLALDSNSGHTGYQASGSIYDFFLISDADANAYLCTGPAWTSTSGRGSGAATSELDVDHATGMWVNKVDLANCRFGSAATNVRAVLAGTGLYLGSMYATAAGTTAMVFNPNAAAGGNGIVLGLYNAYNRVPTEAQSRDSTAQWTYSSTTWRAANAGGTGSGLNNRVTWLDGLGNLFVRVTNSTYVKNSTATECNIGVDFNSTSANPKSVGTHGATTGTVVAASVATEPVLGLNYAQAVEAITGTGDCLFSNGSRYQTLGWSGAY